MNIGFVGLGKLGLPCAMVAATKHAVVGYDPSPAVAEILRTRKYPYKEIDAQQYLEQTTLQLVDSVDAVVAHADIIFCAVQTPHAPLYEGVTRLPETRADFDYSYLKQATEAVCAAAQRQKKRVILTVISTVLPGTSERELYPLLQEHFDYARFVYNPFFIAMGTTIPDYLNPEFILIGCDDHAAADEVCAFYATLTASNAERMSIKSAELCKVYYNVLLGMKIVMANTAMDICHRIGADCDDVMGALMKARERLISTRYLRPGMGDGGNCHPRDQIALSWFSRSIGLKYDLFGTMMDIREKQTEDLATQALQHARRTKLHIVVLGKSFKPETNNTGGSPAVLLKNILDEQREVTVTSYDPEIDGPLASWNKPAVFVVATNHEAFSRFGIPPGSVVLDPWGMAPRRDDVHTVWIGRQR